MKEADFLIFLQHFVKHTRCSQQHPVLLLLGNHSSHISVAIVDFCRDNGITLLSCPPHCSHKLQPLDRSVYGPLKKYVNTACDGWMKSHPGKTMTIYDIPAILKEALPLAATPVNIQKGFTVAGICPFNMNVFADDEFLPGYVTDRPACDAENDCLLEHDQEEDMPNTQVDDQREVQQNDQLDVLQLHGDQPSRVEQGTSSDRTDNPTPGPSGISLPAGISKSPEMLRPFKKAPPRKTTRRGRKKCHTSILTRNETRKKRRIRPEVDWKCIICSDWYSNSLPDEEWIQCIACEDWAHSDCTDGRDDFLCELCHQKMYSDSD